MGIIHILSDTLAGQVAAGEVVERPASVLKELVENSIDAGASAIRTEIRRGGIALLKVSDDGSGMNREDAQLAFQRHATSKIANTEDLFNITHMGFRGEALHSIASVAQVKLITRQADDVVGTEICVTGGDMHEPLDAGCAPGTTVETAQLFFNTPARRKFLKSEETEAGQIEHQLKLHALAFPGIRFTFVRDGQTVFDVPATTDMRQRIADFEGREIAEKLMRIRPVNAAGIHISGFLLPLSEARRNRSRQYIFLNSRPIDDKFAARAIRDGFGGFPTGLHPALYLFIEMEPALVDVNVHPAKKEVRFRRPADLAAALIEAISGTLTAHTKAESHPAPQEKQATPPLPQKTEATDESSQPQPERSEPKLRVLPPSPRQKEFPLHESEAIASPHPAASAKAADFKCELPRGFRLLGILKGEYALFENAEGLALLSPRAAMERIIFEQLLAAQKDAIAAQRLLTPVLIEPDIREIGTAHKLLPLFEKAGFRIAPFGRNTLRVEAIPAFLTIAKIEDFLHELLHFFTAGGNILHRNRSPYEPFASQLAKQYAAKEDIAQLLRTPEALLSRLFACEIPYCTAAGKPTIIPFSLQEIARKFQIT